MTTQEKYKELFHESICEDYDVRKIRDSILQDTDKFLLEDYPITEDDKKKIIEYRAFLRNISKQKEFPQSIEWSNYPI